MFPSVIRIFAAGILVEDCHVTIPKGAEIAPELLRDIIFNRRGVKHDAASQEEFRQFYDAVSCFGIQKSFGGSNTNVALTVAAIFGAHAHVDFWTVKPSGPRGIAVEEEFERYGLNLLASPAADQDKAGIACNLALVPDGESDRSIIKGPSKDVYQAFSQAPVPITAIAKADAIILQGSMLQRSKRTFDLQRNAPKAQIFLSMPTGKIDEHTRQEIRSLAPLASLISANTEEFKAVFGDDLEAGIRTLQAEWNALPVCEDNRRRMAYISDGSKGGYLMSQHGDIRKVPAYPVHSTSTIGAGDAAFAGLIIGYLAGLNEASGNLASLFGALQAEQPQKQSYLIDPRTALARARAFGADAAKIVDELLGKLPELPAKLPCGRPAQALTYKT